ncbi:HAD-IA family hydrolase [Paraglaciecola sp.]|uniref:HAD-IA family hydrolase n=1 Tax=Paraglaciecola sp. TaxID=1920173 RepID=UPI00326674C9
MTKTCLLFDNDGTLVDSEYLCNLAIAQQFAELQVTLDVDYLVEHYRGKKMANILATLGAEHNVAIPDNFLPEYRQRVAKLFEQELKPIANIKKALDKLPQKKAVVSNGPKFKIEQALALCKLQHYFGEHIYSAYDLEVYKPDPQIYLQVASRLGAHPSECVVIEDSITGVTAGSQAGISTLFYNKTKQQHSLPHVIDFDDMAHLPALIADLSQSSITLK